MATNKSVGDKSGKGAVKSALIQSKLGDVTGNGLLKSELRPPK